MATRSTEKGKLRLKGRKITITPEEEPATKKITRDSDLGIDKVLVTIGDSREVKTEPGVDHQLSMKIVSLSSFGSGFEGPIKDKLPDELVVAETWMASPKADRQASCRLLLKSIEAIRLRKESNTADDSWKAAMIRQILDGVVNLRTMNRYQKLCLNSTREAAKNARLLADKLQYKYQNCVAEANYVRREVGMCNKFRSLDEEMNLMPVEEFLRNAPESLRPEGIEKNPHELQLARLQYELQLREELSKQCEMERESEKKFKLEIKTMEETIRGFLPVVDNVLESCKQFGQLFPESEKVFKGIELEEKSRALPAPLHAIFSKFFSYEEVCRSSLTITIYGDMDAALALEEHDPWKHLAVIPPLESELEELHSDSDDGRDRSESSDEEDEDDEEDDDDDEDERQEWIEPSAKSNADEETEVAAKEDRERLENNTESEAVKMEEDEEQEEEEEVEAAASSRSKETNARRGRDSSRKRKKEKRRDKEALRRRRQDELEEKRKIACTAHPLSLTVHLHVGDKSSLVMHFHYYPYFNIITIKANIDNQDPRAASSRHASKALSNKWLVSELFNLGEEECDPFKTWHITPTFLHRAKRLKISRRIFSTRIDGRDIGYPLWWVNVWAGLRPLEPVDVVGKWTADETGSSEGKEDEEEAAAAAVVEETFVKEEDAKKKRDVNWTSKLETDNLLTRLRQRIGARMILTSELALIEEFANKNKKYLESGSDSGSKPEVGIIKSSQTLFPLTGPISLLTSWKYVSDGDKTEFYDQSEEDGGEPRKEANSLQFTGVITRDAATLNFLVSLNSNYPRQLPKFQIIVDKESKRNARNDLDIRDMEREMNYFWVKEVRREKQLLFCSVQKLAVLFDVYLETRFRGFSRTYNYSRLSKSATEERLASIFEPFGQVTNVQLKYTKEGKFRQFAFIGFKTPDSVAEAIKKLDKTFLEGNKLAVEVCKKLGETQPRRKPFTERFHDDESKTKGVPKNGKKENGVKLIASKIQKNDPNYQEFLALHSKGSIRENGQIDEEGEETFPSSNEIQEEEEGGENAADEADMDYLASKKTKKSGTAALASEGPADKSVEPKAKPSSVHRKYGVLPTVKIRGLPYTIKKGALKQFLRPAVVFHVRIPLHQKGMAFATFKSEEEANKALAKHRTFLGEHRISITRNEVKEMLLAKEDKYEKFKELEAKLAAEEEPVGESGRLFIRNLSYSATEEDLEALFTPFGQVTEINLPVNKTTRRILGFAFISFLFPEHAVKALQDLDGTAFQGRLLHILPSKEARQKTSGDGKEFKEKKKEVVVGKASTWNALFVDANAVAEIMADRYRVSKKAVLDPGDRGDTSAAVRTALGETQIVEETRKFLVDNGVCLDAFSLEEGHVRKRSKRIILVKNLPAATDSDAVKKRFGKFGVVEQVILPPTGTTAIVAMENATEAKAAFEALANKVLKRDSKLPMYLEWAPKDVLVARQVPKVEDDVLDQATENSSTIFVKNLNFKTDDEALHNHFRKCGRIVSATVSKHFNPKQGKNASNEPLSLGYGFVHFEARNSAMKALKELQGSSLDDRVLKLKLSKKTRNDAGDAEDGKPAAKPVEMDAPKILVRNIPFQANRKEITDLFKTFGEVIAVRLPKKPGLQGEHRGFGFVHFTTTEAAERALEALRHSTHLYGRRLVLEWAKGEDTVEDIRKRTAAQFHGESAEKTLKKKKFGESLESKRPNNAGSDDDS
ncbi:unnamed protein product [Notodromas monacha]|uniref:RRM domain-containing protein n=1 Tax=Notodromas monacha TaxID=399045 RepID=A0A7R9GBR1_9CRUS|nr:unnamed protein product [Notodromas monacha]CAG0915323.1 unnamed protein product [Notodromas monacha]